MYAPQNFKQLITEQYHLCAKKLCLQTEEIVLKSQQSLLDVAPIYKKFEQNQVHST